MKIGRITIKLERWPWQERAQHWASKSKPGDRWGWRVPDGMGRFGGGWSFKLGIMIGSRSAIIDLLFGSVRIAVEKKHEPAIR